MSDLMFYDNPPSEESLVVIHDMVDDLHDKYRVQVTWTDVTWRLAKIVIPQTDQRYWTVGLDLRHGLVHTCALEYIFEKSIPNASNEFLLADPHCRRKTRRWVAERISDTIADCFSRLGDWSSEAWDLQRYLRENWK